MIHWKVLDGIYERIRAADPALTEKEAAALALDEYDHREYLVFYGIPMPVGAKPVRVEIQEMCQKAYDDKKAAKEERRRKWFESQKGLPK